MIFPDHRHRAATHRENSIQPLKTGFPHRPQNPPRPGPQSIILAKIPSTRASTPKFEKPIYPGKIFSLYYIQQRTSMHGGKISAGAPIIIMRCTAYLAIPAACLVLSLFHAGSISRAQFRSPSPLASVNGARGGEAPHFTDDAFPHCSERRREDSRRGENEGGGREENPPRR